MLNRLSFFFISIVPDLMALIWWLAVFEFAKKVACLRT